MSNRKKSQRRLLLKAGVASKFAPRIVFSHTPTKPEVVIIGAGIAGKTSAENTARFINNKVDGDS
jgi:hypothetical protein